jgi:hypothetical protein
MEIIRYLTPEGVDVSSSGSARFEITSRRPASGAGWTDWRLATLARIDIYAMGLRS